MAGTAGSDPDPIHAFGNASLLSTGTEGTNRMGISLVSVGANISHENLQKKILSKSPATKTNNKENESSLILHSYGFFTHLRPVCPPDLSPGPLFSILTLRLAWKDFSWHSGTTGLSIDVLLLPSSCTNWAVALEQGLSG